MTSWRPFPMLACHRVCDPYVKFPPCSWDAPDLLIKLLFICKCTYFILLGFKTTLWDKRCDYCYPMLQMWKLSLRGLNSSELFCIDKLLYSFGTHSILPHNIFLRVCDLSSQFNLLKGTEFIWLFFVFSPPPLNRKGTQ